MKRLMLFAIACLCVGCSLLQAATEDIDFEAHVLPILREHCLECHGSEAQESQLRLDSMIDALRGGDSGEAVIRPGSSAHSHLIERIASTNPTHRMPPGDQPLSEQQVDVLRRWIDDLEQWSEAQRALSSKRSDHWSFQPPHRTSVPQTNGSSALDSFIHQRLEKAGLEMSPTADRRRLVRRLYLVMHGLPPTPDEVKAFVEDSGEGAWERAVERVLESPRYGERLATHWLDLVRFGETNGFETNRERPNAYPYRDWVITGFQ